MSIRLTNISINSIRNNTTPINRVYLDNTLIFGSEESTPPVSGVGQVEYIVPGTFSWTAPAGVTEVSVVTVGAGGWCYGSLGTSSPNGQPGGRGGSLSYKNSITVVPGNSYTVVVGSGTYNNNQDSYFIDISTCKAGGAGGSIVGDGGGIGGTVATNAGTSAGAGAGGYSGNGGNAVAGTSGTSGTGGGGGAGGFANTVDYAQPSGGGVGIYGEGSNGSGGSTYSAGSGGSGGSGGAIGAYTGEGGGGGNVGGLYGGGAGGRTYIPIFGGNTNVAGGNGAVRIIWGTGRSFPSTLTTDQ